MHPSLFSRGLFAELDRLQREMQEALEFSPSIRGLGRGSFPALNVGGTPESLEVFAFAPGLDPATIEVNLDRGILTIVGERQSDLPAASDDRSVVHINERFSGPFRRVMTLPDDVDPNAVSADYRDGVLHVTAKRRESSRPRRINVQ